MIVKRITDVLPTKQNIKNKDIYSTTAIPTSSLELCNLHTRQEATFKFS